MKTLVLVLLATVLVAQILARPTDDDDTKGAKAKEDAVAKTAAKGKGEVEDVKEEGKDKLKKAGDAIGDVKPKHKGADGGCDNGDCDSGMVDKIKGMASSIPFMSGVWGSGNHKHKGFFPSAMEGIEQSCQATMDVLFD